jgi:hypothetical protein
MTVQPTAQWVQTDLTFLMVPLAAWALAFFTVPRGIAVANAAAPAAKPEFARKARRFTVVPTTEANACFKRGPFATLFEFFGKHLILPNFQFWPDRISAPTRLH